MLQPSNRYDAIVGFGLISSKAFGVSYANECNNELGFSQTGAQYKGINQKPFINELYGRPKRAPDKCRSLNVNQ